MSLRVNRLPPEIISYIARLCFRDDDADARPIVPLTHVCRYWRDSIVSTPSDWTLIFNGRRHLAALSLERAKAAPLTIRLNMNKLKGDPGFLDLLLPYLKNATSLSVTSFFTTQELTRALPNFLNAMPNLRSLALRKSGQTDWSQLDDPFDFAAHTLKALALHGIPLFPSILGLKTLTELALVDYDFRLHLDSLLDFLEGSHSLESVTLEICFSEPLLRCSRRGAPVENRLQQLVIFCAYVVDGRALLSSIALRRGASLEIHYYDEDEGLTDILSGVSFAHLPSISSPTFMEYQSSPRIVRLLGPGGSFSFDGHFSSENIFREFAVLGLQDVQEFRFQYRRSWVHTELDLSPLPSLRKLIVEGDSASVLPLSIKFPDITSPSSLGTLTFLDCPITEGFMAELAQFASDRKNIGSASLNRVVIVKWLNTYGHLPLTATSIERLREHVPVVEYMEGKDLPEDFL